MADLSVAVDVDAPADQVWAALTDWGRQGEWMLGTTVRATVGQGRQVADEMEAMTGIGRVGFLDRMRITRWDPPHVCEVMHFGRLVRGPGAFTVRARGTGSTVIWSEQLDLPLGRLGRWGWPLVRPVARWGLQRSLQRFARWARTYSR
ncbi:MAG: SRPBCC family protein [Geodermatophilaceae bacterium]|nr:SRPBCC family protein [Geodermatophilaceae bacterium]